MSDDDLLQRRGRALTDAEKRAVLDVIYEAWIQPNVRLQRLGQLLFNAGRVPKERVDLFSIEDTMLASLVARFAHEVTRGR
mgnify:CR=1 FL=1